MKFVGLPDTRNSRSCRMFRSANEAIGYLRKRQASCAAGDNGAINVWDDKYGRYRCEAMVYRVTVDTQTFSSLREVRKWVATWLVKIGVKSGGDK